MTFENNHNLDIDVTNTIQSKVKSFDFSTIIVKRDQFYVIYLFK